MKRAARDTKLPGPIFVSPFSVLPGLRLIHLFIEFFPSLADSCARTSLLVPQVRGVICSIFWSHACPTYQSFSLHGG